MVPHPALIPEDPRVTGYGLQHAWHGIVRHVHGALTSTFTMR